MASSHPDRKVCINQAALIDAALCGPINKVNQYFLQTEAAVKRLRLRGARKASPFTKTPRGGVGNCPCLHHVKAWTEDIQKTAKFADDIEFLKRIHVTLKKRKSQHGEAFPK